MKINWKRDKNKIGIYLIRNKVNGKVYIGQSKNIALRILGHLSALRRKNKTSANEHFISEFHHFGEASFEYEVLEYFDIENRGIMKDREMHWSLYFESTNSEKGYNLRLDSATGGMLVHQSTREKIRAAVKGENNPNYGNKWTQEQKYEASLLKKGHYQTKPELLEVVKRNSIKGCIAKMEIWKKCPDLKEKMKDALSKNRSKYKIQQEKRDGTIVKVWSTMRELLLANPEYKRHNIYAVISGKKPTIYGYKWVKVRKEDA